MPYTSKGIFAAIAVALTFGAAQLASGEDLTVGVRTAGIPDEGVNRAAKADRGAILAAPPTRTIDIHVDRLPSTSVLVRVPRINQGGAPPASLQFRSGEHKLTVACEPVVSMLTEIAKQLQPGRCVT